MVKLNVRQRTVLSELWCRCMEEEPGAVSSFLFKLKILSTNIDKANITVAAVAPS